MIACTEDRIGRVAQQYADCERYLCAIAPSAPPVRRQKAPCRKQAGTVWGVKVDWSKQQWKANDMKVGFIGLGNVGGKLSGSLLRNGVDLYVHDLDTALVAAKVAKGAKDGRAPANLMQECEVVITCLPSPAASAAVMADMLPHVSAGKIWMEMSTTDAAEIERLGRAVIDAGGAAVDCPVSGGCHRADTESQLILSGARDVNFTMDLVQKDIGLFQKLADQFSVPLEVSPLIIDIMADGQKRYGMRAQSDRIIERLEEATGLKILADGFPQELVDDEPAHYFPGRGKVCTC